MIEWGEIAGILGAIVLLGNAINAVIKFVKPSIDFKRDVEKCKVDIVEIQKHEKSDLEALKTIVETNKLLCRTMLCLTNHMIDGNGIENMKKTRDEIQELLIKM